MRTESYRKRRRQHERRVLLDRWAYINGAAVLVDCALCSTPVVRRWGGRWYHKTEGGLTGVCPYQGAAL